MLEEVKKQSGFTLIETLISAAILGMVAGGIFLVLYMADTNWRVQTGMLNLQQSARQAAGSMTRELRQALNIVVINNGSRINFAMKNVTGNFSYYLNNSQLICEHPVGTNIVLGNDITNLSFTSLGKMVKVNVRASKNVMGRVLTYNLSEKVELRN